MIGTKRNIALYPWFKFFQNLLFWQATWFLFFQSELSAAEALLIYVFYDIATTAFEIPSGYFSDRIGRKFTLIFSAIAGLASTLMQGFGTEFWMFALAQIALGAHIAFASGTDSALLYESLENEGRADEIERHELRAWRFNFAALGLSAVVGGAMAMWDLRVPYFANAAAFVVLVLVVLRFTEPPKTKPIHHRGFRLDGLRLAFQSPVLLWIFALSALMYGFSHLPFVFGQPFIFAALNGLGLSASAPLVSGGVTAAMMVLSILTSWAAPGLRDKLGLSGILLLAFGLQIALVAGLALTGSALAIGLLLLRMVPNSLSRPFIMARIQPELSSAVRATYLSIQSFAGRLLFAASLYVASGSASQVGTMAYSEIRWILAGYALVGLLAFAALFMVARRREI